MSFMQRFRYALSRFMQGRHGADNLGMFTLVSGLVCSLLGSFTGLGLLSLIGFVLYVITVFRMLSRNHDRRVLENQKYIELTSDWKTKIRQFLKRMKNRRDYRYFKCPNCKVLLRMKRGSGEKDITWVRCGHQFRQKA